METLERLRRAALDLADCGAVPGSLLTWPTTATSRVSQGNVNALAVISRSVEIASEPIHKASQMVASEPIPPVLRDSVCGFLKDLAKNHQKREISNIEMLTFGDRRSVAQKEEEAAIEVTVAVGATLGNLFNLEERALDELYLGLVAECNACFALAHSGLEFPLPVVWQRDEVMESAEQRAAILKKHLYPYVESRFGPENLCALADTGASCRQVRGCVFKTYFEHVVPAQREYDTRGRWPYLIRGSRFFPTHNFWSRLVIPTPTGHFNNLARKAFM